MNNKIWRLTSQCFVKSTNTEPVRNSNETRFAILISFYYKVNIEPTIQKSCPSHLLLGDTHGVECSFLEYFNYSGSNSASININVKITIYFKDSWSHDVLTRIKEPKCTGEKKKLLWLFRLCSSFSVTLAALRATQHVK